MDKKKVADDYTDEDEDEDESTLTTLLARRSAKRRRLICDKKVLDEKRTSTIQTRIVSFFQVKEPELAEKAPKSDDHPKKYQAKKCLAENDLHKQESGSSGGSCSMRDSITPSLNATKQGENRQSDSSQDKFVSCDTNTAEESIVAAKDATLVKSDSPTATSQRENIQSFHMHSIIFGNRPSQSGLHNNILISLIRRSICSSDYRKTMNVAKQVLQNPTNFGVCQTTKTSDSLNPSRQGYITTLSFDPTTGGVLLACTTSKGCVKIYDVDELQYLDHISRRKHGRLVATLTREHREAFPDNLNESPFVVSPESRPVLDKEKWKPILQFQTPQGYGIRCCKWNPCDPDVLALSYL